MSIDQNRTSTKKRLNFHDGGAMDYTFAPGTLSYDSRDGLVVSFYLSMNDGSEKHIGLVPRSNVEGTLGFLAPFGLTLAGGKKLKDIASKNVYASFGAFLLVAAATIPVKLYLDKVKTAHSSYYTLDEDHELCIKEPMYVR